MRTRIIAKAKALLLKRSKDDLEDKNQHSPDSKSISDQMYSLPYADGVSSPSRLEMKSTTYKPLHDKLKKFVTKHFHVEEDMDILDKAIEEMISDHEVDGMSDWEMCEIYDDTIYELRKKHPKKI